MVMTVVAETGIRVCNGQVNAMESMRLKVVVEENKGRIEWVALEEVGGGNAGHRPHI